MSGWPLFNIVPIFLAPVGQPKFRRPYAQVIRMRVSRGTKFRFFTINPTEPIRAKEAEMHRIRDET